HEIEKTRHLFDAAAVPGPDLRADVVDYFSLCQLLPQRAREAQIETRIINQYNRIGFALPNFIERFVKLFSKITVLFDHFPQTKNGCVVQPVGELLAGDRAHLRSAAPGEHKTKIDFA